MVSSMASASTVLPPPTPAHTQVMVEEPSLDDVKPEDRPLVRDVIAVMEALHSPAPLIKGWCVNNVTGGYDVIGHIDLSIKECGVFLQDLEILKQLDFGRVTEVSVRISSTPQFAQLRAHVVARGVPISITQCDIIRIQRKRSWYQMSGL